MNNLLFFMPIFEGIKVTVNITNAFVLNDPVIIQS